MARITLITRHLGSEVRALAKSLMAQQNEVLILTSKSAEIPIDFNIPVFTPFKDWSLLEGLRLLPRLLSQMPDVIHFIFSKPGDEPESVHWLIAQLLQPIPRRITAASFFYSPSDLKQRKLRRFLKQSHIVTYGAHGHLLQTRRRFPELNIPVTDVIPPLWEIPKLNLAPPRPEVERLVHSLHRFFLVPASPEEFFSHVKKSELFFSEQVQFLFIGSRKEKPRPELNYFHLEDPRPDDLLFAMQKAEGLLLAYSDLSILELQQFHAWSLRTKVPLLIRPAQNELFPGLVQEGKNGWILDDGEKSLRHLLIQNPQLKLQKKPDEEPSFSLLDQSTNTLNRLYYKAISLRS